MTTWPASLPACPLSGTLSYDPEPNVVEFQPDVGTPIRRQRYTAKRYLYSGQLLLTNVQRQTLDDFFTDDCSDGSLSFTMNDWALGSPQTFHFMKPPSFEHVSAGNWLVSLNLGREPS